MIIVNLEDNGTQNSEAWTFAQFLKRITYNGVSECAADKQETERMLTIISRIQTQLKEQGIAPR
jgi:hypothetical protein